MIGIPKSTFYDRLTKEQVFNKEKLFSHNYKQEENIKELRTRLINFQSQLNKLDNKQIKISIEIKDSKPILLSFWGDWHIGGQGVHHKQLFQDSKVISSIEGIYYIGMGDYTEEALEHGIPGERYGEILTPSKQRKIAESIFSETSKQCIGLIRGCHPDRLQRLADIDPLERYCEISDAANLWHGGEIHIVLDNAEYIIKARHKARYDSSLRTMNAYRRILNMQGNADIVALAHLHFLDMHHTSYQGNNDVLFFRSGTYKISDEYGQKLNGYKGIYGIPGAILYPNKKLVPFRDFNTAIKFLRMERSG